MLGGHELHSYMRITNPILTEALQTHRCAILKFFLSDFRCGVLKSVNALGAQLESNSKADHGACDSRMSDHNVLVCRLCLQLCFRAAGAWAKGNLVRRRSCAPIAYQEVRLQAFVFFLS